MKVPKVIKDNTEAQWDAKIAELDANTPVSVCKNIAVIVSFSDTLIPQDPQKKSQCDDDDDDDDDEQDMEQLIK